MIHESKPVKSKSATTFLNTTISKVKNTIVVSDGGKKANYDTKISEIQRKYSTTSNYNEFRSDTLDAKMKQKKLANKSVISNLEKIFHLKIKLRIRVKSRIKSRIKVKVELKAE